MSETTAPALTPEEWQKQSVMRAPDEWAWLGIRPDGGIGATNAQRGVSIRADDRHALAALCLFGQRFGFTQQDVDDERAAYHDAVVAARRAQDHHDEAARERFIARAVRHHERADRIAALLPPRES